MAKVFLGIGSNINRHQHICDALDRLSLALGDLRISSIYESEAVGFSGAPFYNLAIGAESDLPLKRLVRLLKEVEDRNGRRRNGAKFSSRTLDIDVLTYGTLTGVHEGIVLPRQETLEYAHVLLPLAEIAGDLELPGSGQSCAELWRQHDKSRQWLRVGDFVWQERQLSVAAARLPVIE